MAANLKSKSRFNLIAFLVLAVLAVAVYMVYRASQAAVANPYVCGAGEAGSAHPALAQNHLLDAQGNDIVRGDQCVSHLQFYLQNLGYTNVAISGLYDGPTAEAVKAFQASGKCKCSVTGDVDKTTWGAIHKSLNPVTPLPTPTPPPAPAPATTKPAPKTAKVPPAAAPSTTPAPESFSSNKLLPDLPPVIDITKFPGTTPLVSDAAKRKAEPVIAVVILGLLAWMGYLLRRLYRQFILPTKKAPAKRK